MKCSEVSEKQQELIGFMETVVENEHNYSNITVEIAETSLKENNRTRWNSLWIMIDSVLKNQAVIHDLLTKYGENRLILNLKEKQALRNLMKFLEIFKKISERMQGSKYPTISEVWPSICSLRNNCMPAEVK